MTKKTTTPVEWTPIPSHHNFRYYVDVDYDSEVCHNPDCSHEYGRCRTIVSKQIGDIHLTQVADTFLDGAKYKGSLKSNQILRYAVMRVITHLGFADADSWDAEVCRGYYGEEIGTVTVGKELVDKVNEFISANRNLSATEIIRNALIVEYGYILESLEGKSFDNIETIKVEDIRFGSTDHYVKIDRKAVEKYYADYEELELPFGICIDEGNGKYRLIDGYHRVTYAKIKKFCYVPMIVVK